MKNFIPSVCLLICFLMGIYVGHFLWKELKPKNKVFINCTFDKSNQYDAFIFCESDANDTEYRFVDCHFYVGYDINQGDVNELMWSNAIKKK